MNRIQRRILQAKLGRLTLARSEEGHHMLVGRPANPAAALAAAKEAIASKAENLDAALAAGGEHTFVGWLAAPVPHPSDRTRKAVYIVDRDGTILDELRLGDSFFTAQPKDDAPGGEGVAAS